MQRQEGAVLVSAGDLVAHLECAHTATLALPDLEAPLAGSKDGGALRLIQPQSFAESFSFRQSAEEGRG